MKPVTSKYHHLLLMFMVSDGRSKSKFLTHFHFDPETSTLCLDIEVVFQLKYIYHFDRINTNKKHGANWNKLNVLKVTAECTVWTASNTAGYTVFQFLPPSSTSVKVNKQFFNVKYINFDRQKRVCLYHFKNQIIEPLSKIKQKTMSKPFKQLGMQCFYSK